MATASPAMAAARTGSRPAPGSSRTDARLEQQPERSRAPASPPAAWSLRPMASHTAWPTSSPRAGPPAGCRAALALHEDRREVRRAERVAGCAPRFERRRLGAVDALAAEASGSPRRSSGRRPSPARPRRGRARTCADVNSSRRVPASRRRRCRFLAARPMPIRRCVPLDRHTLRPSMDVYRHRRRPVPRSSTRRRRYAVRIARRCRFLTARWRGDAGTEPGRPRHALVISTRARTGARRRERAPPARAAPARARRGRGP